MHLIEVAFHEPPSQTAADLGRRPQRFVEEHLLDLNAKQAAIRAGDPPRTAEVQGSRLLRTLRCSAPQQAIDRRVAKVDIDQQWVPSLLRWWSSAASKMSR